jgi:hypothetical protein
MAVFEEDGTKLFFDRLACKARRRSWMVGRAVLCAPHDGSATLIPKSDGGQRSARPTFPRPLIFVEFWAVS